jgi:hypothetical protein
VLAEARRLNRAGFHVAAVATARVAIERILREKSFDHPKWKGSGAGIHCYALFLACHKVITRAAFYLVESFAKRANSVIHGVHTNRSQAHRLIKHAAAAAALLEGGAA